MSDAVMMLERIAARRAELNVFAEQSVKHLAEVLAERDELARVGGASPVALPRGYELIGRSPSMGSATYSASVTTCSAAPTPAQVRDFLNSLDSNPAATRGVPAHLERGGLVVPIVLLILPLPSAPSVCAARARFRRR